MEIDTGATVWADSGGPHVAALYERPASPDAWHQVTAPGGYERWYLDAEDRSGELRVVGILSEGFVFHPGYLRAYRRYRRRPTRVSPPAPRDYCCACLAVYRGGRLAGQFMTQYPAGAFSASSDRLQVTMGPNRLAGDRGGLALSMRGARLRSGAALAAELSFEPIIAAPALERQFFSRELARADHRWVIASPLCRASGTIELDGQRLTLSGLGYHDHHYGTGPIGPGLKRWFWGRVLLDDRVLTFHFTRARDAWIGDEIIAIRGDAAAAALEEIDVSLARIRFSRRTAMGLGYPKAASLGAGSPGDILQLSRPRVIDAQPFYVRLLYDAIVDGDGSRPATAFCEVAYPHRLRWPILGRMIERSIDKRPEGAVA